MRYTLLLTTESADDLAQLSAVQEDWILVPFARRLTIPDRTPNELIQTLEGLQRDGVNLRSEGYGQQIWPKGVEETWQEGRLFTPRVVLSGKQTNAALPRDTGWYQINGTHWLAEALVPWFKSILTLSDSRRGGLVRALPNGPIRKVSPQSVTTRLDLTGQVPLVTWPLLLSDEHLEAAPSWIELHPDAQAFGIFVKDPEASSLYREVQASVNTFVLGPSWPVVRLESEVGQDIASILNALRPFGGLWPNP